MKEELAGRYGRYIPYVVCILAAAVFIALFSAPGDDPDRPVEVEEAPPEREPGWGDDDGGDGSDPDAAADALSRRLAGILSGVQGAGTVRVEVTLGPGPRVRYHEETRATESDTQEADAEGGTREITEWTEDRSLSVVRSSGGDELPVIVEVEPGEIRGVLVVAEGAGDPRVRAELSGAVATLLDVGVHRVKVLTGKGGE